jgi:uncharacterized protein (DUF1800 family)
MVFISASQAAAALSASDVRLINRLSYGLNSSVTDSYLKLGRKRFIEQQLDPAAPDNLPPEAQALLQPPQALDLPPLQQQLQWHDAEQKRIRDLPDEEQKKAARKALEERTNLLAGLAMQRHLVRALYSQDQLREQMAWFWLNHFNVFQYKGDVRVLLSDYEDRALRPYALGHFRDLVLATLTHPAMLIYLDNAQNGANHVNENYARELMELHTLGVNAGYTQQDVQELARILTGVGINRNGEDPHLPPKLLPFYVRDGLFEFNPRRHDFGDKQLLGHVIQGRGFNEVSEAVDILVQQPATARFISHKLALYWLGEEPSAATLERMAQTFRSTDGDIAATLRTLFATHEFNASLGHEFRDPQHYVLAALRFAYDGKVIRNYRPVIGWLGALGEPLYGHQTPDGYGLTEKDWASPGQMSQRFEIARAIGSGYARLFEVPEGFGGMVQAAAGFPQLSNKLFFDTLQPMLSAQTQQALQQADSQQQWNTYLLSAPEFMYR